MYVVRMLPLLVVVLAMAGCWGSDDLASPGNSGRSVLPEDSVPDVGTGPDDEAPTPDNPDDGTPDGEIPDEDVPDEEIPDEDVPDEELPDDPSPPDDPVIPDDPVPPVEPVVLTEGHLYLPTSAGIRWHYNDGALQAAFTGATQVGGQSLRNLSYSNGLVDYVLSEDSIIGYGGSRYSMVNVADGITYSMDIELAQAHRIFVSRDDRYSGLASVSILPLNLTYAGVFPYNGRASPLGIKPVAAGELGTLPARGMRVVLNPGGWLGDLLVLRYPQLADLLERRTTDLWFSPGVGIVQRINGGVTHTLTSADGIQQPLVFEFAEGSSAAQAPQQILVQGEVLTDSSWTAQTLYRTSPTGWLNVAFDGSGSWRVSLDNMQQPEGIHAATVRMTRGNEQYDVTVMVWVR